MLPPLSSKFLIKTKVEIGRANRWSTAIAAENFAAAPANANFHQINDNPSFLHHLPLLYEGKFIISNKMSNMMETPFTTIAWNN